MSTEKQGDAKPKIDLGLLEEDDEFEEFPAEGNVTSTKGGPRAPGAARPPPSLTLVHIYGLTMRE